MKEEIERIRETLGNDDRAAVSGIEGLKQVRRLAAANLAHYDVIRAVAQSMAHQLPDRDGSGCQSASLEANAVGPLDAQLSRVLDDDDALVGG